MATVRFSGRVFPAAANVALAGAPTVHWKDAQLTADFRPTIHNGRVTVECDVAQYDPAKHFNDLHRRATEIARTAVDLIAFGAGQGLTLVLDEFQDADGETGQLVYENRTLIPLCTALGTNGNEYGRVLQLVIGEPLVFFALRDLIVANTQYNMGPINCARAVETLRTALAPNIERKKAWRTFGQALNLSEVYLRMLTEHSIGPRHGDHGFIDGPTTTEILQRAWSIMNRFLEYRKRGNQQLPLSDFPILA